MLSSYQRTRLLILTSALVCFLLFWWAGKFFGIPAHAGYEASLLQQPSATVALLVVVLGLAGCLLIGTAIAGSVGFEAGLLAAMLGLSALSFRGGPSRYVIFRSLEHSGVPAVFLTLALEMAILGALIAGSWLALRKLLAERVEEGSGATPPSSLRPDADELTALVVQIIVTTAAVVLLGRSEAKLQVMAAVFLGSLAGPLGAHFLRPVRPRTWYWLPPLVVGFAGYVAAYLDPGGAATADLTGTFAALARPIPLDYASAGVSGAILGHWMAMGWQHEKERSTLTAAAT